MTAYSAGGPWRMTAASERGSAHGADVPNQDAVSCIEIRDGAGTRGWLAAVSDGHGGRRYVRSNIGSRVAVEVATTTIAELLSTRDLDGCDLSDVLRQCIPSIVEEWRSTVLEQWNNAPFTDLELERAGTTEINEQPVIAYGATLLVAVVSNAGIGVAQIGDGDVLVRSDGLAIRPVPGDSRLVAGETTSLCLDTAVADFRFASLPSVAETDLVLLSTDGYGNSFADTQWWRGLVADLALFVDENSFEALEQRFSGWLAESAVIGGDDVSAVVLARVPLVVSPAAAPVVSKSVISSRPPAAIAEREVLDATLTLSDDERPTKGPESLPRSKSWRVGAMVVAAVCIAVAILMMAWATFGPGPAPGDRIPAPSSPPSSNPPSSPAFERSERGVPRRGTVEPEPAPDLPFPGIPIPRRSPSPAGTPQTPQNPGVVR